MRLPVLLVATVAFGCGRSSPTSQEKHPDAGTKSGSSAETASTTDAAASASPVTAFVPHAAGEVAPWLAALKRPANGAPVAFGCDKINVVRGWHYRGEAATVPSPAAELAAFHVRSSVTDGYAARLVSDDGSELDTTFVFVRADAAGNPTDRFYESTSAWDGPLDIVAIAAVPKGTTKLVFRARNPSSSSNDVCDTTVTLGVAPPWPAMPRYEVVRMALTNRQTVLALFRAENVLPLESSAPTLSWKPLEPTMRDGMKVQEIRAALPRAIVSTNADGEPSPFEPKAPSRWLVAEYPWRDAELPNQYTAGDRIRSIPTSMPWAVSPLLGAALDEAAAVKMALGNDALDAFVSGSRAGLEHALAARQLAP